ILITSFFYFFIILIYRLMGKREVGQLGIVDLIVSILIAELVAISVEDTNSSILISVIPILCLTLLEVLLSYGSLKSNKIRFLLDGNPTFIIKEGKLNYKEMIRQKYNLDDLMTQLREKGERNIEDIEYAILENNGTLSVFPYTNKNKSPLPMPIIIDGKIRYMTLKEMNKDEKFIIDILKKNNVNLKDVFYAFYKNKNIFIIRYNDLNK
ncbi:MAG: DUF421 domain-containing protein, partial [Bacilli bacterium]|nr:DUF421 domain-containing protein [Bacilli bacterium]